MISNLPPARKIESFVSGTNYFLNPQKHEDILWEGISYPSFRNAWEASKSLDPEHREKLRDMNPVESVKYGLSLDLALYRDDWEEVNDEILLSLSAIKFGSSLGGDDYKTHLENALNLVRTGTSELIYNNYIHENQIGNCVCDKCITIPGTNRLGETFSAIRAALKQGWDGNYTNDHCDWCWDLDKITLTPSKRLMYWTKDGLRQTPCCFKHHALAAVEADETKIGSYYEIGFGFTQPRSFYPAQTCYYTPSKTDWGSFIWDCSTGEKDEFKVEKYAS